MGAKSDDVLDLRDKALPVISVLVSRPGATPAMGAARRIRPLGLPSWWREFQSLGSAGRSAMAHSHVLTCRS